MIKSKKKTYLRICVMSIAFILLFYVSIFYLSSVLKNKTNLIIERKAEAARLDIQNKQIDSINNQYEKLEKNFDEIASKIVKYSEIYSFIKEVNDNIEKETGITFTMTSRDLHDIDDQLAFVNYDINMSGEFSEIMHFFDYMENLKYKNDIEEVSMSNSGGNIINASAKLKVYTWK